MNAAVRLLTRVGWNGPLPSVVPTSPGGVQLEWGDDDDGVEIVFSPGGDAVTVLIDVHGEMTEHQLTDLADPFLAEALAWAAKLG